MEIRQLHHYFLQSRGISTDTRENLSDKIFVALKGENFDGNQFAEKALKKGARFALVDDPSLSGHSRLIHVNDSLTALQHLATFHRNYLNLPIIALTGSNGKTTTKELIAAVLSEKFNVSSTPGNFNNHIGVPLTLLNMDKSTEMGVVEMGANHQKEIESLCKIARPKYGYITNFGKAHLEGFGGFKGVIKGKSELYDHLVARNGKIFVNADDAIQMQQSKNGHRILFSQMKESDCQVTFKTANPYVKVEFQGVPIKSQLLGNYNAKNITAAIGIGDYFNVGLESLKAAVENYKPDNNRSQIIERKSNQIILDAYNANPTSMKLALENLETYPQDKPKIAILGDMFEIGETSAQEHQKIVDLLEGSEKIHQAFVCGGYFNAAQTKMVHRFANFKALKTKIAGENFNDSIILIKGSRAMAMERLIDVLN